MNKAILIPVLLLLASCSSRNQQQIPVFEAVRGDFQELQTEEGVIRAVNSTTIGAPAISYRYGGLKITRMIADGTEVEEGDTLLVFDPSEIKKAIITSEQQLEIAKAEYEKLKAMQESEIEDLEADLEITRISQEISRINFEQAVFESDVTRREISLKLETANISLARAREQIDNKKKIQHEELLQKQLSIKQLKVILADANLSLDRLFLKSPSKGIAIIRENWMTGQKWAVSDQCYPGSPMIDLPDLEVMQADVKVNEVDVAKVIPGQKVVIRADAFSDITYTGEVVSVANLAQNKDPKSKIKVFPVQIMIDGINPNLLPGLSVSCRILIRETSDVLSVPVQALFQDPGSDFVYVKSSSGFKKQEVKTGPSNNDFVIIYEGLIEGDRVALLDPFVVVDQKSESNGGSNR